MYTCALRSVQTKEYTNSRDQSGDEATIPSFRFSGGLDAFGISRELWWMLNGAWVKTQTCDMCYTTDLGRTSLHTVSNEPGSWLIRELEYLTDLSVIPTQQVPPSRVCKT